MSLKFRLTIRQVLIAMVFLAVLFVILGKARQGQLWAIALLIGLVFSTFVLIFQVGLYWLFRSVGVLSNKIWLPQKNNWNQLWDPNAQKNGLLVDPSQSPIEEPKG